VVAEGGEALSAPAASLELNRCVFGDALKVLRTLPDGVFDMCCTSPPYWALREYRGHSRQLGLERTPDLYVRRLVRIFREVRRVLKPTGLLFLNLGDSYAGSSGGFQGKNGQRAGRTFTARIAIDKRGKGLKPKDLVGIPWMVAFALRKDGWWLRSEIVWHKPSPQPESVADRPTKAHEQVFVLGANHPDDDPNEGHEKLLMLSKSHSYAYHADAILEPVSGGAKPRGNGVNPKAMLSEVGCKQNASFSAAVRGLVEQRNARDVWTIASEPYRGPHFATMPTELVRRCILAGSREGGSVLDVFLGSGTVGLVAEALGRRWLGVEIERAYEPLIRERTRQAGMYFDPPEPEPAPVRAEPEQIPLEVGT
jgi:DNA modification methylase